MLWFGDGEPFAVGAAPLFSQPSTFKETVDKPFVQIRVNDAIEATAAIDTGGVYLVCGPQTARLLRLDRTESLGTERIVIRGVTVAGDLYRVSLTVLAERGADAVIHATALVVRLNPGITWDLPDFVLGWHGCLERLRLAIDPVAELVYFGEAV